MKMHFSVVGIRGLRAERLGFAARPVHDVYEVELEGTFPHAHNKMSLHITEEELDLFPIDSVVPVTVEPKTLAGEPTHGETRP